MPIKRIFLSIDKPALPSAVDHLVSKNRDENTVDLRNVIAVLPGSRAGRRLTEILVERSEEEQFVLTPPLITTPKYLPENLYSKKKPFASELAQRLAWVRALNSVPRKTLNTVIPKPPPEEDSVRWFELGDLLRRQHMELAADGLNFQDVADRGESVAGFTERKRWLALREIQNAYLATLDKLELWDEQTARLVAIEHEECTTDRQIVLIGTVDMNVALRRMIDQVADNVTTLVFAPEDWSNRFDSHGCLEAESWSEVEIPVNVNRVHVVDDPSDQAAKVTQCLANYDGRYRADDITIGVADEQLVPHLERRLAHCEVAARWGPGRTLAESPPVRFCQAVIEYLRTGRHEHFASLVRHPDMTLLIEAGGVKGDWISQLDEYHEEHLQSRLGGKWLGPPNSCDRIRRVVRIVDELLRPLQANSKSLGDWAQIFLARLHQVYGQRIFDRTQTADQFTLAACEKLRDAVQSFADVPESLAPKVNAVDALRWTVEAVQSETVPPPMEKDAVEMLGWLELSLDDAPALVASGLNDGIVPESLNSDLFLPNTLRQSLGLMDNDRRYARDAYALTMVLRSRKDVDLIVGRRDDEGNPLIPSRLLFATDGLEVARRTIEFFDSSDSDDGILANTNGWSTDRERHEFSVPSPLKLAEPITRLSVTSFRDYLACKYRFYLKRVLRLRTLDDSSEELSGATFGNVLHEVLKRFGACLSCNTTDVPEIEEILLTELNVCRKDWFGEAPRAAVNIQFEQMRLRLSAFAREQARWASDGWQIEHTEIDIPTKDQNEATFPVDGESFMLTGRIDRIDFNAETGQRAILDYKSSDSGKRPEETHLKTKKGPWIDLQLPLYRHLIATLGIEGPVQLGYVNLPKDIGNTRFALANWTDADLEQADEVARGVVRGIRDEQFWPPTLPAPSFYEDFAAICQDQVFDKYLPSV